MKRVIKLGDNTNIQGAAKKRENFMSYITKIEDEETKLLKLQKQYRKGEIKEEDMTKEQVDKLCELYDKQIAELKKSNETKRKKILEYRKKNNKF